MFLLFGGGLMDPEFFLNHNEYVLKCFHTVPDTSSFYQMFYVSQSY